MNLLDRYCAEVGKHLPRKNRADIEAEIRSTLEDMLNDRSRSSGQPADETLLTAVLKEYGAPAKVAAAYQPTAYLIGPRLYPVFELVIKIVGTVLFAVALAGLAISIISRPSGPDFLNELRQFGPPFFGGVMSAFGGVVLVFAILERVLPANTFETNDKEWDPAELARAPDPDGLKRPELIFNGVVTAIFLTIINLYPNVIGIGFVTNGRWAFIPALSGAFFGYLPWINLLGVAQIAFNLFLLSRKAWQPSTRLAAIALKVGGIGLACAMLTGPTLVALSPAALAGTPLAGDAGILVSFFSLGLMIALTIIIVVTGIEVAQAIYRLRPGGTRPRLPVRK